MDPGRKGFNPSKAAPTKKSITAIKINFPFNLISVLSDLIDSRAKLIPVIKNTNNTEIK